MKVFMIFYSITVLKNQKLKVWKNILYCLKKDLWFHTVLYCLKNQNEKCGKSHCETFFRLVYSHAVLKNQNYDCGNKHVLTDCGESISWDFLLHLQGKRTGKHFIIFLCEIKCAELSQL